MSLGGQGGQWGTELVSSPNASEVLGGEFGGPDRTKPYRVVRPSPTSPASSDHSRSPSRPAATGERAGGTASLVPQMPSRPFSSASRQGGRDKPVKGAGPVPLSPTLSPNLATSPFRDEDEAALFCERAGIREFDGGLSRPAAERLAWLDLRTGRA
jgi:hypothetical protein